MVKKETRNFKIKFKFKGKDGQLGVIDTREDFEVSWNGNQGTSNKKQVSCYVSGEEHKFNIELNNIEKGWFRDKVDSRFLKVEPISDKPVSLIEKQSIYSTQQRPDGWIAVGIITAIGGGIIGFILWKRKKSPLTKP